MNEPQRVIRLPELVKYLSVSRSTIYSWTSPRSPQFDQSFPKKIRLGERSVGFILGDVQNWLKNKQCSNLNKSKGTTHAR
ncbi:prophage regulatory protein [Aeromonas hydrophila]|uniref:helix-turn-helix transcriptional regulator n=1 Tax=Aeromonas hydrophila TaxID=644 RepID=UPI0035B6884B|nr:prophage regulatory protein [Aeromonas hydrophila]